MSMPQCMYLGCLTIGVLTCLYSQKAKIIGSHPAASAAAPSTQQQAADQLSLQCRRAVLHCVTCRHCCSHLVARLSLHPLLIHCCSVSESWNNLRHTVQALLLSHPRKMTRDTATYPPLMMSIGKGQKAKPRSLRHLAETELGLSIQAGEHSPVDDARSTLYLYHKHRKV